MFQFPPRMSACLMLMNEELNLSNKIRIILQSLDCSLGPAMGMVKVVFITHKFSYPFFKNPNKIEETS